MGGDAKKLTPLCYFGDPASYEKVDASCNNTAIQISDVIYDFLSHNQIKLKGGGEF